MSQELAIESTLQKIQIYSVHNCDERPLQATVDFNGVPRKVFPIPCVEGAFYPDYSVKQAAVQGLGYVRENPVVYPPSGDFADLDIYGDCEDPLIFTFPYVHRERPTYKPVDVSSSKSKVGRKTPTPKPKSKKGTLSAKSTATKKNTEDVTVKVQQDSEEGIEPFEVEDLDDLVAEDSLDDQEPVEEPDAEEPNNEDQESDVEEPDSDEEEESTQRQPPLLVSQMFAKKRELLEAKEQEAGEVESEDENQKTPEVVMPGNRVSNILKRVQTMRKNGN